MRKLVDILLSSRQERRLSVVIRHMCEQINNKSCREVPSVGIIIIGDEILKGQVQDTNSHFLCKKLFSLGVKVKKISLIPDDLKTISDEVLHFSQEFTHVITSGGVGPTHDDRTFEGVARAFNDEVYPHPELVALCKEFFGTDDLTSPKLKLAFIPKSAKLHYGVDKKTGQKNRFPLVAVSNVYVFPGVPRLMEQSFIMLEDLFRNPDSQLHTREVYLAPDEVSVTGVLNEVDAMFKDKVILGSYPDFYNSYYKVKLILESDRLDHIGEVEDYLKCKLPEGSIVQYDKDPVDNATKRVYDYFTSHEDSTFVNNLKNAVRALEECFEKYSQDEICVGFNGGKDCTALLHLTYAVFKKKYPDNSKQLKILYIRRDHSFPELELFIKKSIQSYRLDMIAISGRIKESLSELHTTYPHIKAVIMGTRSSDPNCGHLRSFTQTDPDWPPFMRVSPLLKWSYQDIWTFLRQLNLPYCNLYDRGYTSLGSLENTHPNPALQIVNSRGIISYKPAYQLTDGDMERAGRN